MGSMSKDQYSDPRAKCSPVSKCWNLGSITHPAKPGLGTTRHWCSNFPLKQLPVPSRFLGITVSHLQTREQMWLKSFHCCNLHKDLLAVEDCQIFQIFLSWMCCSPRLEKCHSFPHPSSLSSFFLLPSQPFSHSFLPGNKDERKEQEHLDQHLDHSFEHSAQVGDTQHSAGCCRALTCMLHSGSL